MMKLLRILMLFSIFLQNTTFTFCMTSIQVSFSNIIPPVSALLRIIVSISIHQCAFECSIREQCDSIGYKTVVNVCKLYARSEQLEENEHVVITVSKIDMNIEKSCTCSNWEVCDLKGPTAICIRTECPPLSINNGRFIGNGQVIGAKRLLQCDYGYSEQLNKTEIHCLNSGEWSDNFTCIPVDCGELGPIRNGLLVLEIPGHTSYPVGATVNCDDGYERDKTSISCLSSRLWETANCNIVCPSSYGWLNVTNDFKIQFRHDPNKTYQQAKETCIAAGTQGLLKLNRAWKKSFVKEVLTHCQQYSDIWYWVDGTAGPINPVWHFSDGEPIIFDGPIQWHYNRPKYNTTQTNACMSLHKAVKWADRWCNKYMSFICEI